MSRVERIDLGPFPTRVYFCPTKAAWSLFARGVGLDGLPYPTSNAATSHFTIQGRIDVVVTVSDEMDGLDLTRVAALLVHEVVHVVGRIKDDIGEKSMGEEVEAYLHQRLFERLWYAYSKRLHKNRTAELAKENG